MTNRIGMSVLGICFCVCSVGAAAREVWPSKPIRLVNPYTPGGAVDTVARTLAQQMSETWGQPVIVDNRPGAGTTIGMDIVAQAVGDGYTLLVNNGSVATVVPLYPKLALNPVKDFAPIALAVQSPYLLGVQPSLKVNNVQEFIAYAKARPGQLLFGSTGMGSLAQLTMELLKANAKIDLLHVPYKGGAPNITALLSGEVQAIFGPVSAITPLAKIGKIKALAVSSAKRVELAPEIPTVAEQGVPSFEATSWYPIFAPARTPLAITQKANADINRILQKPEVKSHFLALGMIPVIGSPEMLSDYLRAEINRWTKIIISTGVKPE